MATLFQVFQFFDGNGDPLGGGKLYWYEAGTTTPKDTWIDQAETNPAPNPIVLDSEGRPPLGSIWIRGSYKLVLTNSDDVVINTVDDINEYDSRDWTGLTASIADLNSTTTSTITRTSDYTVVLENRNKTILVDANSGNITITLPAATTALNTFRIYIKNISVNLNEVIIATAGSETIDSLSAYILHCYNDLVGLQCDGTNWHAITKNLRGPTRVVSGTGIFVLNLGEEGETILASAASGNKRIDLPAATAVGRGYRIKVKKTDSSSNYVEVNAPGAETVDGGSFVLINKQNVAYSFVCDGANWHIESSYERNEGVDLPRGYINGYLIEQNPGDLDHDITFYRGDARDTADTTNFIRTANLVKQLDNTWAEGTNQGGRPASVGLSANTWYHCFLIGVPGTNTETASKVDAGFDTSLTASNLLTAALPFGYTTYRYVGSILTDASENIVAFRMEDYGDFKEVYWNDIADDFSSASVGDGTGTINLRVPLGKITRANVAINCRNNSSTSDFWVYLSTTTQVTSPTAQSAKQIYIRDGVGRYQANQFSITTNSTRTIDYSVDITPGETIQMHVGVISWVPNLSV